MMPSKRKTRFKVGDWTVHYNFGVGEVEDILEKGVGADRQVFYKIKTDKITYWLPLDNEDCNYIQHIRNHNDFRKAINVLSLTPDPMETQFRVRKNIVHERSLDGSLSGRATLIRDLNGWDKVHNLNYKEKMLLTSLCQTFIDEWVKSDQSITLIEAKDRLKDALKTSMKHVSMADE